VCFRQGCVVSGRGEFSAIVRDEKRSATTSAISALGPGACYSGVSRVFSK